jgi:hypothetical protein
MTWQKGPNCFWTVRILSVFALLMTFAVKAQLAAVTSLSGRVHGYSLIRGAAGAPETFQFQNEKLRRRSKHAKATVPQPGSWKAENARLIDVLAGSETRELRVGSVGCVKARYFDLTGPAVARLGANMEPGNFFGQVRWSAVTAPPTIGPIGMSTFFERHCDPAALDFRRIFDFVTVLRGRLRH